MGVYDIKRRLYFEDIITGEQYEITSDENVSSKRYYDTKSMLKATEKKLISVVDRVVEVMTFDI